MSSRPRVPNILIVEDEKGPQDALRVVLRPFCHLHIAATAESALQALREFAIDLVTLDLMLPDRNGLDLLKEMKQKRDDLAVIVITGYGSCQSAMTCLKHGAAGYLLKPFNCLDLLDLVSRIMKTLPEKQEPNS